MEKRTATYWSGSGFGIRILDITHGIEDYATICFVMHGKQSDPYEIMIQTEIESGEQGFAINEEWYALNEFIVDEYPNI